MGSTSGIGLRSESKPLILIAASALGLVINQQWPNAFTSYGWVVRVGLFFVVYSIVAFVRIGRPTPVISHRSSRLLPS